MAIQLEQLTSQPRLLMEARLEPLQGTRFQPTGFPDLGAAVYDAPGDNGGPVPMVLVESAQSMANRLEYVCWDDATASIYSTVSGMPYVSVTLWDSGDTTNSLLEAHRLNSPYIMSDADFAQLFRTEAKLPAQRQQSRRRRRGAESPASDEENSVEQDGQVGVFNRSNLARAAFKYDPGSVLHGVFLEKLDGRARLQRCLSGFIEARQSNVADSGGVKNDRVAPAPSSLREIGLSVSASDGYGNVPFHRTEYTADSITAYFNLDLAQIRAYGLGENAERFLVTLGLWKVRKFLNTGLRLRTACDLAVAGNLEVTQPVKGYTVPPTTELEADLPTLIQACGADGLFANPPITQLTFQRK